MADAAWVQPIVLARLIVLAEQAPTEDNDALRSAWESLHDASTAHYDLAVEMVRDFKGPGRVSQIWAWCMDGHDPEDRRAGFRVIDGGREPALDVEYT